MQVIKEAREWKFPTEIYSSDNCFPITKFKIYYRNSISLLFYNYYCYKWEVTK